MIFLWGQYLYLDCEEQKTQDFSNGFFIFFSLASGSILILDFDAYRGLAFWVIFFFDDAVC